MIGVKNKGTETLKARYDGKDYVFAPDQTVACPVEAAQHIFGYGQDDKTRSLHRLGWITSNGQTEAALERLKDFTFVEAQVTFKDESKTIHLPSRQDMKKAEPEARQFASK